VIGANEMWSFSVSYSKVLTFSCSRLIIEKWCSTLQDLFVIDLRVKSLFDTKLLGLVACSAWLDVSLRCFNSLNFVMV